ncbi:shikimate kinase [Marinitoga lauensis]|uniref:shikimate kinase n=1 Tax=Marinitoga lauensis TaxID=2201189 RepID=UPI0019802819|nr:shikimate kinase [Marinitoga lauensis]
MPIYLIGMMGSGKTTIGKLLSEVLNKEYIDFDTEIEKLEGKTINRIFSEYGEEYFRNIESKVLFNTENKDAIISTGGGVILKEKNRKLLKKHNTFFLYASVDELIKRVETENRPLLKEGKEELYKIWHNRKVLYEEFKKIDLSELTPYEATAKLLYEICEAKEEIIENDFQNIIIKLKD